MSAIKESFVNSNFPAPAEAASVHWAENVDAHILDIRHAFRTVMSLYLTDEDARVLHAELGASLDVRAANLAAEAATAVERCPNCFGEDGRHSVIHHRNEAGGGGSNLPCPNSVTAVTA